MKSCDEEEKIIKNSCFTNIMPLLIRKYLTFLWNIGSSFASSAPTAARTCVTDIVCDSKLINTLSGIFFAVDDDVNWAGVKPLSLSIVSNVSGIIGASKYSMADLNVVVGGSGTEAKEIFCSSRFRCRRSDRWEDEHLLLSRLSLVLRRLRLERDDDDVDDERLDVDEDDDVRRL